MAASGAEKKRHKNRLKNVVFAGGLIGLGAFATLAIATGFLGPFERRLVDFRFQTFNQENEASQEIVYIDIDDTSLTTLSPQVGGWPWPRGLVVGDLIVNYVMFGNPAALIFDVIYSEYSPKLPDEPISDEDFIFADFSSYYPNLSHAVQFREEEARDAPMQFPPELNPVFEIEVDDSASTLDLPEFNAFLRPYDELAFVSPLLHAVNHREDPDGVSRRNQMLVRYQDRYYPGLALRGLEQLIGASNYRIVGRDLLFDTFDRGEFRVPLARDGDYQLNFYDTYNKFISVPADSLIGSAQNFFYFGGEVVIPPETFEGKIVVIGASALGLKDVKSTPVGGNIGGPYIHITAMSNILMNQHIEPVEPWISIVIAIAAVAAILAVTVYVPSGAIRATVAAAVIIVWMVVALLLFQFGSLILEMAATLTVTLLAYLGGLIFSSLSEAAEKNKISSAMGKYISPSVMSEVLNNYDQLVGEVGQSREITILFSDIRSFSSISEKLTAATVVEVLNQYLAEMIKVVFEKRGTLDKIIGDAIMAFWGAPSPEPKKEQLALETAIGMIRNLEALNPRLEEQGYPPLRIGVGLHTGDMIVGNIGSEQRLDFTAIGDNVNLGSRLEGLTKYYKSPILVSEPTYEPLKDAHTFVYVDHVAVKGKTQGIGIYFPIDPERALPGQEIDEVIDAFRGAREQYGELDFVAAGRAFKEIAEPNVGGQLAGLGEVFAKRCAHFLKNPPPDNWNGIWTMTEK